MTSWFRPGSDYRHVTAIAIPIVLANLTQPLLGMVDTAIAGHFPDVSMLGGVAVGALMFSFLFWTFGFLRMSTTGLIAQSLGAHEAEAMQLTLWRALTLAFFIGMLVVALQGPLIRIGSRLLTQDSDLLAQVHIYCASRVWSAPFALANYVVLGYLLGVQKVRTALIIQVLVNLANILAAVVLVYTMQLQIFGIGAATAVADMVGFILGVAVLIQRRALGKMPSVAKLVEVGALLRLFILNANLLGRTLCLLAVFAWFTRASAQLSVATLAANTVLLNFQTFMAYGLDGFAQACETLVGEAIGARDGSALRRWIKASTVLAALVAAAFCLAYGLLGSFIIDALTDLPSVRTAALAYLPFVVISPIISVWGFQLDGVFIGATRTRDLFFAMIVSSASFVLALQICGGYGNAGLWIAFLAFMAVRGLALAGFLQKLIGSVPVAVAHLRTS